MKFVKINYRPHPSESSGSVNGRKNTWKILIDNQKDLKEYCEHETMAYTNAFLNEADYITHKKMGHPSGHRAGVIETMLNLDALKQEKVYPLMTIGNMVDGKYLSMLGGLERGNKIVVNERGGYCYLQSFLETWDGKIVEEIEKPDCGFPTEEDALKSKYLILENNDGRPYEIVKYCKENKIEDYACITTLQEKDLGYVLKCIQNADTIMLDSLFEKQNQLEMFMNAFSKLDRKNILIFYFDENYLKNLKEHRLYAECIAKHNVKFIKK